MPRDHFAERLRRLAVTAPYLVALAAVGAAVLLRLVVQSYFHLEAPFLLFFAAVVVAAWNGGVGPGLFATLTAVVIVGFFLRYDGQPGWNTPGEWAALVVFVAEGTLVSVLTAALRRANRRIRTSAQELLSSVQTTERLAGAEQAARAEARMAERSIFLGEASAILSSSLDAESTLAGLARHVAQQYADWCLVDILRDDGSLRTIAAPGDPDLEDVARKVEGLPLDAHDAAGPATVLRTAVPELRGIQDEDRAEIDQRQPDPLTDVSRGAEESGGRRAETLRELGLGSWLCVPMEARGRMLGTITFARVGRSGFRKSDVALAEDLAHRAALALDNSRLYAQAQQANRSKDDFLAVLSHELRTPLHAMLGWSQMLRWGGLDAPTSGRALETIERNTRMISTLIEDLLDVSRITSGKVRLNKGEVSLDSVVRSAVDVVQPHAHQKEVDLSSVVDPHMGSVWADPERLQQVVWNLLSNGVKFTPAGGRVEVRLERTGSRARISVSDTGEGIPPSLLPHVFEPFYQEETLAARENKGLGLGLSIVRQLVELHGGRVRAESAGVGRGATFTVELPLLTLERPFEFGGEPRRALTPQATPEHIAADLEGLHVLIVDDEADARELVRAVLERSGARVTAVETVQRALEELESGSPDVVVSDLGLPERSGYDLARRVRTFGAKRGREIPAIALTGHAREADRTRSLLSGFRLHLAKPVEPHELVAAVRNVSSST